MKTHAESLQQQDVYDCLTDSTSTTVDANMVEKKK